MTKPNVAIVGSGIVGTTMAYLLSKAGHTVDLFERGKRIPSPQLEQFEAHIMSHCGPEYYAEKWEVPKNVRDVAQDGDYPLQLVDDQVTAVGGKALYWGALSPRMSPKDFHTRTQFNYGTDWPIAYDELEPYYCKAEAFIGVSGDDADNPFAPPRSKPYPMPAFELGWSARVIADRMRKQGIALGRHPQARNSVGYGGRGACANFGLCSWCPTGARYCPVHHLELAEATSRCTIHTQTSVRRILVDASGRGRALLVQKEDARQPTEHPASIIIVAGGPIESSRLMLLSTGPKLHDGLGNHSGQVGKNFFLHHVYDTHAEYKDRLFGGRANGIGYGVSFQFVDSPKRGQHGGLKYSQWDSVSYEHPQSNAMYMKAMSGDEWIGGREVLKGLEHRITCQEIGVDVEVVPGPDKYVKLSTKRDRFGDPFAHVHYKFNDFDRETESAANALLDRLARAGGGERMDHKAPQARSGHHHMGGLCMGDDAKQSVVDRMGRVHGAPNVFVAGGATFPSLSAVNPTLTMVAMGIRTAEYIADQFK